MSLNLDPRRRAMLREMGVRVWQPEAPVPAAAVATDASYATEFIAARADLADAAAGFSVNSQPDAAPATAPRARPSRQPAARQAAAPPPAPTDVAPGGAESRWLLGQAQTLFADSARPGGARWLVLAETSTDGLAAPVLEGDAGKLLGNMLRAAGLDTAGAALLAQLARRTAAMTARELPAALAEMIAQVRPDVVLLMGRPVALALLPSGEPFGRLRGKAHTLHGIKTVVTYDAAHLLRKCEDKAGAWSDLCLAVSLAAPAGQIG